MDVEGLKTSKEFCDYCFKHNFNENLSKNKLLKYFNLIERNLTNEDDVLITFVGYNYYPSSFKTKGPYVYAVTDSRILLARKKTFSEFFIGLNFDSLGYTSLNREILSIDTLNERLNIKFFKNSSKQIYDEVYSIFSDFISDALEIEAI